MVTENTLGHYRRNILNTPFPLSTLAHFNREISPSFYDHIGGVLVHTLGPLLLTHTYPYDASRSSDPQPLASSEYTCVLAHA